MSLKLLKKSNIIHKEIILPTEYGNLSVLSPTITSIFKKIDTNSIIHRDICYLDDNSKGLKTLKQMIRSKDYFMFKPESHFINAKSIFETIKKELYSNFYGEKNEIKNPFKNCKTTKDIFNLSRNIKLSIKKDLSRFGIKLYNNGEIDLKFSDSSFLKDNLFLKSTLKEFIIKHENEISEYSNNLKFSKHDYFCSVEKLEGAISYLHKNTKGIPIKLLNDKKIYPMYGVFSPTRTDYLDLFAAYLKEKKEDIDQFKRVLDVGCGSGVLSFILAQSGIKDILSIDNNPNAVLCTKNNTESLGFFGNIQTRDLDLNDLNYENEFDLIVCNPPWLNASYVFSQNDFDNSIYDPEFKFLKTLFLKAERALNNNKSSRLVIIFSNLGELLELHNKEYVEALASKNNFNLKLKRTVNSEYKTKDNFDPLKNFKKQSKIILYEFKKNRI